jgi:hypothetical protein
MKLHLICPLLVCATLAPAQNEVDSRNLHERILAVVPLTGTGTYADPRRPIFAPIGVESRDSSGIIECRWTPSDDGRYAVVEFVALSRKALQPILSDPRTLKAFERGKSKKDDIERELRIYRKDFSLEERKKP